MNKNIDFDNCTELIYKMISTRCRVEKARNRMKSYEVLPSDRQLASSILSNTRNPKKNPYLITSTYFQDVCNNLHFRSVSEMLWGRKEEWEAFGGHFFHLLIIAILNSESPLEAQVETALSDYAPYAEAKCYFHLQEEKTNVRSKYYYANEMFQMLNQKENENLKLDHIAGLRRNAIGRLYSKIETKFIDSYLNFFENENTIKLNDKLNKFVIECLPTILKEERSNVTFPAGPLIQEVLNALINLQPSETDELLHEIGNYHNFCTPETEEDTEEVLRDFRRYNSEYVAKIIEIQRRLEYEFYEDLLIDKWDYYNFL